MGGAALVRGAAWLHVPYPIALVLVGLAAGAVPGLPEVIVDPHVVFLVFLPPLLLDAAVRIDWYMFKKVGMAKRAASRPHGVRRLCRCCCHRCRPQLCRTASNCSTRGICSFCD